MILDVQAWQMCFGVSFLAVLCWPVRSDWRITLPVCYFALHATITAFWPNWNPGTLPPWLAIQVQRNGGLVALTILGFSALYCERLVRKTYLQMWSAAHLLIAVDLVLLPVLGGSFLLTWHTFAAGVYACLVPYWMHRGFYEKSRLYLGFCIGIILNVIWNRSATGYLCLGVGFCAYLVARKQWRPVIFIITACALAAAMFHGVHLNPNGRLELWESAMGWWETNANYAFGAGSGAFEYVGAFIPDVNGTRYRFLHNDYLHVLFDTGFLGLFLFLWLTFVVLRRAFMFPELFATACAFCACMLVYFPMHFFMSQFLMLGFVGLIMERWSRRGAQGHFDKRQNGVRQVLASIRAL